jgi:4-amino-4-deoxy-L-arabinose transferase-like glycosyltransferase
MTKGRPGSADVLIMALICGAAFFWRLGLPSLFDFNEGLYVEAAREMLLRHDWIMGTVNGVPFYDKPPLALWCAVAAFRVLGVSELAARLPVALAATLTVGLTFSMARAAMGRAAGLLAGAFLALNPLFMGTARQMTMDIHQTLWVTAAMAAFWCAEQTDGHRRALLALAFWASCGLGFMAKSFPGLLPIPVAAVYIALTSKGSLKTVWSRVAAMQPLLGPMVLALVIAPWHIMAYQKSGPFFINEYWTQHHVGLLKGTEYDHAQPVWYYIPMLLAGFFPWSLLLPLTRVRRADFAIEDDESRTHALAVVWVVVIFLAFTAMRSKLVSYLLPIYPACAILAARAALRQASVLATRLTALLFGAAGSVCIALVVITAVKLQPLAKTVTDPEAVALMTPEMFRFVYLAFSAIGIGMLAASWLGRRDIRRGLTAAIGGMMVFVAACCTVGLPAYERAVNLPLRRIVADASGRTTDGTPLIVHIGRPRRPSVFFYLPSLLFARDVAPDRRQAILLETWDAEPVRELLKAAPHALVLGDHAHAARTLEGVPGVSLAARHGRWALFQVEPSPAL